MCEAVPPLPEYVFMAWFVVMHRDDFTYLTAHVILFYEFLFKKYLK
jgi:hypothetical protein